ncbi:MAG: hypothetical protein MI974_08835 [Chitinophagales bacterium]|nr:hypothetical protein [Chitinophagales bacterium]
MKNCLITLLVNLLCFGVFAQGIVFEDGEAHYELEYASEISAITIPLPEPLSFTNYEVESALLQVSLVHKRPFSAGERVKYSFVDSLEISTDTGIPLPGEPKIELSINERQPEMLVQYDITGFILDNGNNAFNTINIDVFDAQIVNLENILVNDPRLNDIQEKLRLKFSYVIKYRIGAAPENAPTVEPAIVQPLPFSNEQLFTRKVDFTWSSNGLNYPGYEFQLLRLFNYSETTENEYDDIVTQLDWKKATSIYTHSSDTTLTYTVIEGTGFYAWRVRPIGNFHPGGIANSLNYGQWSYIGPTGLIPLERATLPNNSFFFFEEPNDDQNWIYSKFYTEDNRIREEVVYADELLGVRQTQTYVPSQEKVLIQQTVLDYLGRPSLSTLPTPVPDNRGMIYKPAVLRSSRSNDVYGAADFDANENYMSPDPVVDDETPFSYYSDNNPDVNIPSAEGYPFTRTRYENAPNGRVIEQSGVGVTHMVAPSQDEGMGHTVKTHYAVAARDELIRVFGADAPRGSSVMKQITVDQNNVATLSYMNQNGQLIATALSFSDTDTIQGLLPLTHTDNTDPFTVNNTLKHNIATTDGLVSFKRIFLGRPTVVNVDYTFSCPVFSGLCTNTIIDCRYLLEVSIVNIDLEDFEPIIVSRELAGLCQDEEQVIRFDLYSGELPPGTYVIEKKLISENGEAEVRVNEAREKVASQIVPLTNLVSSWLDEVDCIEEYIDFVGQLQELSEDIANIGLSPSQFNQKYTLPETFELDRATHFLTTLNNDIGRPFLAVLNSACCQIRMDVAFVPPMKCPADFTPVDRNNNGRIDVSNATVFDPDLAEFQPDFEAYAKQYLIESGCGNPFVIEATLYGGPGSLLADNLGLLRGWNKGEFNWMIYHMLNDRYTCNGSLHTENRAPGASAASPMAGDCENSLIGGIGIQCSDEECTQYTCEELFSCWGALLDQIRERLCEEQLADDSFGQTVRVSEEVDGEAGDNGDTHDDHIDDEASGWQKFLMWLSGASGKVRDGQEVDPSHLKFDRMLLGKEFLNCVGYRFAAVLTDQGSSPPELLPEDVHQPGTLVRGYQAQNPPFFNDWDHLFPGVRDYVFAFKYYYYNVGSEPVLEATSCFIDPNRCNVDGVEVPCCPDQPDEKCDFCGFGIIECDNTYEDWSCGQRFTFFKMLQNKVEDQEPEDIDYNPGCDIFLQQEFVGFEEGQPVVRPRIVNFLDTLSRNCASQCESRATEFRNILVDTLLANCYVIGECRSASPSDDFIIPDEDLNLMVEGIVNQCKEQCQLNTYTCDLSSCRQLDMSRNTQGHDIEEYTDVRFGTGGKPTDNCTEIYPDYYSCSGGDLSYCDLQEHDQAKIWDLELSIPTKCEGANRARPFQCVNTTEHTCINYQEVRSVAIPTTSNTTEEVQVTHSQPVEVRVIVNEGN